MAPAWFFSLTLLVSSSLLMIVQPLCAKMVLPYLGGTPSVWNTCMVFFQAGLLAGYGYAHLAPRRLGLRRHAWVHLLLTAGAFATLPIVVAGPERAPERPALWLLTLLTLVAAPAFVMLASTGPLVQRWFAAGPENRNPYFLYAASNLGSMLGLVAYPFLVEPNLTLAEQSRAWQGGYALLLVLLFACALGLRGQAKDEPLPSATTGPDWRTRLRWLLLAMAPASLMLSVTGFLTTDIAPIPLLWLAPIALYLLTFTLVFARRQMFSQRWLVHWLPAVVVLLFVLLLAEGTEPIGLILGLHLAGFFWVTMVCHGELARTRPAPAHLTEFYLMLAVGGVLGGTFTALFAPLVFSTLLEYPLMLVLACYVAPPESDVSEGRSTTVGLPARSDVVLPISAGIVTLGLVLVVPLLRLGHAPALVLAFGPAAVLALLCTERPRRCSLMLAGLLAASLLFPSVHGRPEFRARSFFGVHTVTRAQGFQVLVHGNTVHGKQWLDPERRDEPLTYYHRTGPIGQLLQAMRQEARLERVGLVGLGTGALASYAQSGQRWTFFEIDPVVKRIAEDPWLFTFLRDSRGKIDVILGDARLTLQQSDTKFGLLVIDAFGSDAVPLHLLTREAFAVYRERLLADGLLAFHISNRYLDLEPVLANLAAEAGWSCHVRVDLPSSKAEEREWHQMGKSGSIWALLVPPGVEAPVKNWPGVRRNPRVRPWTDDFSNLLQVLKTE